MKPVILTFVHYYLPGFRAGGSVQTVANMVERLSDEFEFRIVTQDRDMGDDCPYPDIQPDTWMTRGKALVRYVPANRLGLRTIVDIARSTPHDLIYLNSFFDPRYTQQVLICHRMGNLRGRPIVIASRGEFSVGALRLKRFKKLAFIKLAIWFRMYDDLTWQASSTLEAEDIQRVLFGGKSMGGRLAVGGNIASMSVAPDVIATATSEDSSVANGFHRRPHKPLRVCFLSRISQKKNLDFALHVLAEVRVPVRFAIYGPIEDAPYWARCKALIAKLPSNVEVEYDGTIEHARVVETLAQHDLFLFPTRGENFGHVIHEALRAGLPLLISDLTPWVRLEEQRVGWDLPLRDISEFARRCEVVAEWSATEYTQWSSRALALASQVGHDPDILDANRRLFRNAISRGMRGLAHGRTASEVEPLT